MNSEILKIIKDKDNKLAEKHAEIDSLNDKKDSLLKSMRECDRKINSINEEIDDCTVECINALSECVANRAQNDVVGRFARSLKLNKIVEGDYAYITYYAALTENDLINLNIGNEIVNLHEFLLDFSGSKREFSFASDTCSLIVTTENNIVTDIELNYF